MRTSAAAVCKANTALSSRRVAFATAVERGSRESAGATVGAGSIPAMAGLSLPAALLKDRAEFPFRTLTDLSGFLFQSAPVVCAGIA